MTPSTTIAIGPNANGTILSRTSVNVEPTHEKRLGFGFLVSQGAIAGIIFPFTCLVVVSFVRPLRLPFLYFSEILTLIMGLYFGIGQGIAVGLASLISGRRVGFQFRSIIGGCFSYLLAVPLFVLDGNSWSLFTLLMVGLYGSGLAIVAALPIQYWRILIRGVGAASRIANAIGGITGFLLRLVVTGSLVNSLLLFSLALSPIHDELSAASSALLLGQFTIAWLAVMLRLKLIPLVVLSVLANGPVVHWLYSTNIDSYTILVAAYLTVWGIYVLSHTKFMSTSLQFLYEEFRYYLID